MKPAMNELEEKGKAAKTASRKLAFLSTEIKNRALVNIAEAIIDRQDEILAANKIDYEEAKASGMGEAMLDRLMLSPSRLEGGSWLFSLPKLRIEPWSISLKLL
jgi:glutamate-5-semialdehyde dehydrogenase